MSRKSKGINAERDLIHKFWSIDGWSAVRIAGSGSMKYPSADILATNKLRKLAIECKTSKEANKYLTKDEIEQLKEFAKIFGAEPWVGVKFNREEWFFLNVEDLKHTGNNFLVSIDIARNKGLLFEELIK
ncbi:Holliday junction resolvase [Candidatus Woesearchaeota archaeon]|nr:Holliday junction resolvase [Candidatus Woesearchaeota archaeon]